MSSGKVKCTCGWSWNKSDSSKKDMYICHECGRDNSNNMKNGGWLDSYADGGSMQEHQENYNDYKVSAPKGMVGDGFSNVGRNYSPAWGGQFAMGGSIPGSVGFTYARTQGIPSEGRYAKKTLPSAQNGHEMSFYQNGLDWTPKNISKNGSVIKDDRWKRDVTPVYQQGGYIPKAQSGIKQSKLDDIYQNDLAKQKFEKFGEFRDTLEGTDEVMYGTPEYEKAYKEGRFADVPNQLDEITISPYTKQFPYYEQLTPNEKKHLRKNINSNDPITRQLKARAVDGRGFDADKATDFAKAWAIDLPLSSLQVPQSALVEGVEGLRGNDFNMLNALDPSTQRIPSETWGIENPYAAFAVDAITDPEILLGMSLLKQPIQKGLQRIPTSISPELRQGVSSQPSVSDLENMVQNRHNNLLELFNTPEGKRRLTLLGIDSSKLNTPNLSFKSTGSGYFPKDNSLDMDIKQAIKIGIDPKSIYEHEIGHWLQKQYGDQSTTLIRQNFYTTPIDKQFISSYPENFVDELLAKNNNIDWDKISKETSASYMLNNLEEGLPFLREMRQNMINKNYIKHPYEDISEETVNKFIKENPNDRVSSFTEPNSKQTKIVHEIFKNLPAVAPIAGASYLATQTENKQQETPQFQKGGIIKDNNGYWNPDNWGKPVEIDSNQITMKGVNQPLLGISDTGDTKLMKPGKNYKFKGKKVTEFPMAKNGIRQEQKGLVNLNQLTNFTNYNKPTVGGWLNKYSS
jgi:hypothetical protein